MRWCVLALFCAGCSASHHRATVRGMPTPTIQVGACGEPGRDGVMGGSPKVERADRDLDGDGTVEAIVVDRALCTPEGNCYWNVFVPPRDKSECARYAGTFEAAALEPLATKGDDNMRDVRAYYTQTGGRLLLQSYRFLRGGYQIVDVIQCKRSGDDRLECADHDR